ncbi:MAG: hypothetical protein EOM26_04625 [Alphaproteobacteria bacterium]|nr:hypothetical protein [Alphaproteobacteria bacterium]
MRRGVLFALWVAFSLPAACAHAGAAPSWSFEGPFGVFERSALQRGFRLYVRECSDCAALSGLRYGDLESLGFNADEIALIARELEDIPAAEAATLSVRPVPGPKAGRLPDSLGRIFRTRGSDAVFETITEMSDFESADAADVTAFVVWSEDPHLEARKKTGLAILFYLLMTMTVIAVLGRRFQTLSEQ